MSNVTVKIDRAAHKARLEKQRECWVFLSRTCEEWVAKLDKEIDVIEDQEADEDERRWNNETLPRLRAAGLAR